MCGIVGYAGPKDISEVLINGLSRLEYRGYDSAGIALIGTDDNTLHNIKRAGKLKVLKDAIASSPLPAGSAGIGHTRWATHGGPTDNNAHPHLSNDGKIALIHNGIIENFAEMKAELAAEGYEFSSETDTEAAAVYLGKLTDELGDFREAFRRLARMLVGQFTILAVHTEYPELVLAARHKSPLVIGIGDNETFLGSDVAAFVQYTNRAIAVDEDRIVEIIPEGFIVTDFNGQEASFQEFEVDWDASAAQKGGWSSFMVKEIYESPTAVSSTLTGRIHDGEVNLGKLGTLSEEILLGINRIVILACGTASYAGMVAKYAVEEWAKIPVEVELSHEFGYREAVIDSNTLVISVSQSGETMDTMLAVRKAKELGARTLSICNTQGATIPRESDAVLYTHAGPEVAVASTKAFVAQVTALYLFGLHFAKLRNSISESVLSRAVDQLVSIPEKIGKALELHEDVKSLAVGLASTPSVLFLGRHVGYPVALEGALKLKELSYIHAEGFAAGELKHGPIALIEGGQPVIVIVPSPRGSEQIHSKVVSNIKEISARGAQVIAIAEAGDASVLSSSDMVIPVPLADPLFEPLLAVVPLQFFALELATAKKLDVDQPRNLAKSVTVE
ncbi:MAG: glutamine--fructose-6-phosphate transaminase (isomerizing) [Microbacteriaceae bacterium]|nr:glutamine--fructose-6-phosphate transaminase (isomerizing) [Microbacteriaceae bacterium]